MAQNNDASYGYDSVSANRVHARSVNLLWYRVLQTFNYCILPFRATIMSDNDHITAQTSTIVVRTNNRTATDDRMTDRTTDGRTMDRTTDDRTTDNRTGDRMTTTDNDRRLPVLQETGDEDGNAMDGQQMMKCYIYY